VQRRAFFRWLALLMGAGVLGAHILTTNGPIKLPHWTYLDMEDFVKHTTGMAIFAITYRLSYRGTPKLAARNTVLFCSLWGGFCEVLQHFIPARDFSVFELGTNTMTPALIALLSLVPLLFTRRD
jgi:VanZ family protein